MTLTEQVAFLRAQAAEHREAADMAVGIATIERQERATADALDACAATIDAERRRRIECAGDWS